MSGSLTIDYSLLGKAQEYYSKKGYQQIDLPPWVTKEAIDVTLPKDLKEEDLYKLNNTGKYLIGSAEQGFFYLIAKGLLPPGKYFSITPCFRFESQDFTHRKFFMKCELFHFEPSIKYALRCLMFDAEQFFKSLTNKKLEILESEENKRNCDVIGPIDINLNGEEIGSYGIRKYKGFNWVYGTGLAEPRFSLANRC